MVRRGSFIGGFLVAVALLVAAAAIGYFALDLRIEEPSPDSTASASGTSTELSKAEVRELGEGDRAILVFCTEDRGPRALVEYSTAVDRIVGFARDKPNASTVINPFEIAFSKNVPTMQQRLTDYADLIRRKCGEPRGLGSDSVWENDVEYLQEVAQQLATEGAGS